MSKDVIEPIIAELERESKSMSPLLWIQTASSLLQVVRDAHCKAAVSASAATLADAGMEGVMEEDPAVVDSLEGAIGFTAMAFTTLYGAMSTEYACRSSLPCEISLPLIPSAKLGAKSPNSSHGKLLKSSDPAGAHPEAAAETLVSALIKLGPDSSAALHPDTAMRLPKGRASYGVRHPSKLELQPLRKLLPVFTERELIRSWNDALCALFRQGTGFTTSANAALSTLLMVGKKIWVNFERLSEEARRSGLMVPSLSTLFVAGIRIGKRAEPITNTAISKYSLQGLPEPHDTRRSAGTGGHRARRNSLTGAPQNAPTGVPLSSIRQRSSQHDVLVYGGEAQGAEGMATSCPSSFAEFFQVVTPTCTGTKFFVSTLEPGNVEEQLHVVMPIDCFANYLRRFWRVAAKAAIFRRRLIYVLMMDRLDSDLKIQRRMLDLLTKLRGPQAVVNAMLALLRNMGPPARKLLFIRLAESMKSHSLIESTSEISAETALIDSARTLCGCQTLRDSVGRIAAERLLNRRINGDDEKSELDTGEDALSTLRDMLEEQSSPQSFSGPVSPTKPLVPKVSSRSMGGRARPLVRASSTQATVRYASQAVTPADVDTELLTMSNGQIAREIMLLHTELQKVKAELDTERMKRAAADAELAKLRLQIDQMHGKVAGSSV